MYFCYRRFAIFFDFFAYIRHHNLTCARHAVAFCRGLCCADMSLVMDCNILHGFIYSFSSRCSVFITLSFLMQNR